MYKGILLSSMLIFWLNIQVKTHGPYVSDSCNFLPDEHVKSYIFQLEQLDCMLPHVHPLLDLFLAKRDMSEAPGDGFTDGDGFLTPSVFAFGTLMLYF